MPFGSPAEGVRSSGCLEARMRRCTPSEPISELKHLVSLHTQTRTHGHTHAHNHPHVHGNAFRFNRLEAWRLRAFDALLGGPTWFLVGDGSHAKSCDMNQHVIQHEGATEPTCASKLGHAALWRSQDVSRGVKGTISVYLGVILGSF